VFLIALHGPGSVATR
jgi:hypothetical protein